MIMASARILFIHLKQIMLSIDIVEIPAEFIYVVENHFFYNIGESQLFIRKSMFMKTLSS